LARSCQSKSPLGQILRASCFCVALGGIIERTVDVYDETFFDGIDATTNALDNIKARKNYVRLSDVLFR